MNREDDASEVIRPTPAWLIEGAFRRECPQPQGRYTYCTRGTARPGRTQNCNGTPSQGV